MRTLISICVLCAGLSSTGYAQQRDRASQTQPTTSATLSPAEVSLLNKLHASNLKEIAASKLATDRARNEGVKNYGLMLIKHHGKADQQLQTLATRAGVKLTEPGEDPALTSLKKHVNPATFDRAYLDQMSDAHEAGIAQVREAQGTAANPELQALLNELLPVLQQHRDQAVRLLQNNPF